MPDIFTKRVYLYPLIGALQGLGLYFLVEEVGDTAPLIAQTAMLFLILAPNLFYLSLPQARAALSVPFSLGLAALFAGLVYLLGANSGTPEPEMAFTVPGWFLSILLSLIALPFLQARGADEGERTRYEWLHGFAWHNVFAIILSWVFVGAVWLMLFLLSALFNLINIDLLEQLLEEAAFASTLTFATFGAGLAVTLEVPRVVEATHALAFALLRVLAVPFAAAAILFLILLPFTGLEPLWETRSAATILIWIVAGAVLLSNAVWQDAPGAPEYPAWALKLISLKLVALPAYAVIAAYALWLRIDQYGLTPDRIYASAITLVALLGTLSYAVVLLATRLNGWDALRQTNIRLVAPVALIGFALITPLADPMRISAANQVARLKNGTVSAAEFDFGMLKYRLGRPGQKALAALRADQTLPDREVIDERLAVLDKAQNYYEWAGDLAGIGKAAMGDGTWKTDEGAEQSLILRPKGAALPEGFWDFMKDPENYDANPCFALNKPRCAFIIADIYPGGLPEVVLVREEPGGNQTMFRAYQHFEEGGWRMFYDYYLWEEDRRDHDPLWQRIEAGEVTLAVPTFKVLEFGDGFTLFAPEQNGRGHISRAPRPAIEPLPAEKPTTQPVR